MKSALKPISPVLTNVALPRIYCPCNFSGSMDKIIRGCLINLHNLTVDDVEGKARKSTDLEPASVLIKHDRSLNEFSIEKDENYGLFRISDDPEKTTHSDFQKAVAKGNLNIKSARIGAHFYKFELEDIASLCGLKLIKPNTERLQPHVSVYALYDNEDQLVVSFLYSRDSICEAPELAEFHCAYSR